LGAGVTCVNSFVGFAALDVVGADADVGGVGHVLLGAAASLGHEAGVGQQEDTGEENYGPHF